MNAELLSLCIYLCSARIVIIVILLAVGQRLLKVNVLQRKQRDVSLQMQDEILTSGRTCDESITKNFFNSAKEPFFSILLSIICTFCKGTLGVHLQSSNLFLLYSQRFRIHEQHFMSFLSQITLTLLRPNYDHDPNCTWGGPNCAWAGTNHRHNKKTR